MTDPINLQYTTIKTPLPDFIYKGLKEYSTGANLYRPQPEILINKLAQKDNFNPENIFLTAGIDEALHMFILTYGQHTTIFTPTYIVYKDVEEFGYQLTQIYSIENNEYNITTKKQPDATLIILANPNNPSGFTPKEKILELINNNQHAIVVIDEAYAQFTDLSVINQLRNYKNLAVLRSFSKDYGMAGNRVGYIVSHPDIINKIKNKTQWSNVSYLSIGAAVTALDHEDYFSKLRQDVNHRRDDLLQFLKQQNYSVLPSRINAVLLKFPDEKQGTQFFNYLKSHNIISSHGNGGSNIGLNHSFVRISIGTKEQMETLNNIIKQLKSS